MRAFVHGVAFAFVVFGVFLGDEVGDADVEVKGCGCAQGAEKVVGDDRAVIGFGYGGDFFAVSQASCQGYVRAHVLGSAVFEEFAKFPY